MRLSVIIAVSIALLAIGSVQAASDCNTFPSTGSTDDKAAWCAECNVTLTRTNLTCASCSAGNKFVNYDKSSCIATDCSTAPPTRTDGYCAACSATDKYATVGGKACSANNCGSAPSPRTDAFCAACEATKTIASADKASCIAPTYDCAVVPGAANPGWCTSCKAGTTSNAICKFCDTTLPFATKDTKSCSAHDCSTPPQAYTNDYCSSCDTTK